MSERNSWQETLGDALSPGDVIAGKYRAQRIIGRGGMGVVLEAWHLDFDEPVALKLLLPEVRANDEAVGRFEREARAAFKIKGEHVARVLDVGKTESGAPYLVMEFLDGSDLADVLAREKRMSVGDAVDCILQACDAVAEAHSLGIVHRDLKPENLFMTRRPDGSSSVKVLDFGLSKVHGGETRDRMLTATYQVMGTPHYMSPEQWLGAGDVGPSADLWALAVILYELITGAAPFRGDKLMDVCRQVLEGEPPAMASFGVDVPPGLEAVILACLRKTPKERIANVGELAVKLHAFAHREGRLAAKRASGVLRSAGIEVQGIVPSTIVPPAPAAVADDAATTDFAGDSSAAAQVRRAHAFLALAERARATVDDEPRSGRTDAVGERVSVPTLLIADADGHFADRPVDSRTKLALPLEQAPRPRGDTPTAALDLNARTSPPPALSVATGGATNSPWATVQMPALAAESDLSSWASAPKSSSVADSRGSKPRRAAALETTLVTGAGGPALGRVTLASRHRHWGVLVVVLGVVAGLLALGLLFHAMTRTPAPDEPTSLPGAAPSGVDGVGSDPVPSLSPSSSVGGSPRGAASARAPDAIGDATRGPSVVGSTSPPRPSAVAPDGEPKPRPTLRN